MKIRTRFEINASAAQAWTVLADHFGDVYQWAGAVRQSKLDRPTGLDAIRTCSIAGFGPIGESEISERITEYDPQLRLLSYRVESGLPPMMAGARNRWQVVADGSERCVVTSEADLRLVWWMRPLSPLIKLRLSADLRQIGEEFRHRVEHGVAHPRVVGAAAEAA